MSENPVILKTKLLKPKLSRTMVRERFFKLYDEFTNTRITMVTAGAGYGKTTLIAQGCEHLGVNTVWYSLDRSDVDFVTWLYYLVSGIRQTFPDFGNDAVQRIRSSQKLEQDREMILRVFINELENAVDEHLVIVLDDYHLVCHDHSIQQTLEFLLEFLPVNVHLIIASRREVNLNLARLIAGREAFYITENDLVFTRAETAQLCEQDFKIHLQEKDLKTLSMKTQGWISGLILFNYLWNTRADSSIEAHLENLTALGS